MTLLKYPHISIIDGSDVSHLDRGLLSKADTLREALGCHLIITSGYRPKDMGSQHALGLAIDIMAPEFKGTLHDLYLAAEHLNFKGIGVYPHWHYMGVTYGGLHLDERLGKTARWMGVLPSRVTVGAAVTKQEYIALNSANLKAYGVI